MGKTTDENEEKKYNKFQWFLFVVLIPLLFTVAIVCVVLSVAGINVLEAGKSVGEKIPFISGSNDGNKEKAKSTSQFQKQIADLEAKIKDRKAEVTKLEDLVDSRDQTIQRNDLEKQQLEKQIEEVRAAQEQNKLAFKEIVRTYETMSAKKSAPIITKLGDDEAVKLLSNIKADTLAGIMEQMKPEDAARLTKKLTINSEQKSSQAP
jgi:flagellar motility protein MotE (MotC chaperone)